MVCYDIFINILEFCDLENIYIYQSSCKYLHRIIIDYLRCTSIMKKFMEWCTNNCKFNTLKHLLRISSDDDVIDISLNSPARKNCLKTISVLLSDTRIKTYTPRKCICKNPDELIEMKDKDGKPMYYEDGIIITYRKEHDQECVVCWDNYQNHGIRSKETSALHIAATNNYMEMFKLLLSCPRVSPMNPDNLPLLSAIQNQNIDMVRLLLDYNDLDVTYYEDDPLYEALRIGNSEILIMLFQHPTFDFEYIGSNNIITQCSKLQNSKDILSAFESRKKRIY